MRAHSVIKVNEVKEIDVDAGVYPAEVACQFIQRIISDSKKSIPKAPYLGKDEFELQRSTLHSLSNLFEKLKLSLAEIGKKEKKWNIPIEINEMRSGFESQLATLQKEELGMKASLERELRALELAIKEIKKKITKAEKDWENDNQAREAERIFLTQKKIKLENDNMALKLKEDALTLKISSTCCGVGLFNRAEITELKKVSSSMQANEDEIKEADEEIKKESKNEVLEDLYKELDEKKCLKEKINSKKNSVENEFENKILQIDIQIEKIDLDIKLEKEKFYAEISKGSVFSIIEVDYALRKLMGLIKEKNTDLFDSNKLLQEKWYENLKLVWCPLFVDGLNMNSILQVFDSLAYLDKVKVFSAVTSSETATLDVINELFRQQLTQDIAVKLG